MLGEYGMNFMDIILILIFLYGIYIGWQSGFFRELKDFITFFLVSLIASKVSDILFGLLYKTFPFFNFKGKAQGLKSINIILWKIILYVLIIIALLYLVRKILTKLKIESKILDTQVDVNIISRICGVIFSGLLMVVVIFNIGLILLVPNLNFKALNKSLIIKTVMSKTPILANANYNLYSNIVSNKRGCFLHIFVFIFLVFFCLFLLKNLKP